VESALRFIQFLAPQNTNRIPSLRAPPPAHTIQIPSRTNPGEEFGVKPGIRRRAKLRKDGRLVYVTAVVFDAHAFDELCTHVAEEGQRSALLNEALRHVLDTPGWIPSTLARLFPDTYDAPPAPSSHSRGAPSSRPPTSRPAPSSRTPRARGRSSHQASSTRHPSLSPSRHDPPHHARPDSSGSRR